MVSEKARRACVEPPMNTDFTNQTREIPNRSRKLIRQICVHLCLILVPILVCAQTEIPLKPRSSQIDPNKFAVIINGASGEEEYAKQFEQWRKDLVNALTRRYGFDPHKMRVLTEKPADSSELRSTADEV